MNRTRTLYANKYYIVYKTTCLITNKIYVGKHITYNLNDGYIGNGINCQSDAYQQTIFHCAVKKYGYENFKREIIEYCENEFQLNEREIYWIKQLSAHYSLGGYNMTWGGDGGDYLSNHPNLEVIKVKMRGRIVSEEQRQRQRMLNTGKKLTVECLQKKAASYLQLPLKTCEWCGYTTRNVGNMIQHHGVYCKQNPNRIVTQEILNKKAEIKAKKLKRYYQRPLNTCPHCGKQGRGAGMKKFHFDNCKYNPNYVPKPDTRPLYICPHCSYQSRNKGNIVQNHFDNCVKNPNRVITFEQLKKKQHAKEKMRYTMLRKPNLICPHCGFTNNNSGNMHQYHFDNCHFREKVA